MTRARAWVAAALVAGVSTGCVLKHSTHSRLYVLRAVAPPVAAADQGPQAVLGVERVSVPAWMDRPELTSRTGRGEVVPDPLARWGEPITRGIQRVVTENLAALLPERHLIAAPYGVRQAVDHRLDMQVTECARQPDGAVLLEARWAILAPDGAVLVQRRSSQRAGAVTTAEGTVDAMSQALGALGGEIAAAVRALPAAAPVVP